MPHFTLTVPLDDRRLVEISGSAHRRSPPISLRITQLVLVFKKPIYVGEDSDGVNAAASLALVGEVWQPKHPQSGGPCPLPLLGVATCHCSLQLA